MNNIQGDELQALTDSKSEVEWNKICDKVKKDRDGAYPGDWYAKVIASGLARKKQLEWANHGRKD